MVDDNGDNILARDGMPTNRAVADSKIIDSMTKQLEGQMLVTHHGGVRVEISMPLPEVA